MRTLTVNKHTPNAALWASAPIEMKSLKVGVHQA